jgi:SAM-dependent methyltransferase
MNTLIQCRVCGRDAAEALGSIPSCGHFAGKPIKPPINGGELCRCQFCHSMFRSPVLSQSRYLALYEAASNDIWQGYESERHDFLTIYTCLADHSGGSILDIGCFTGGFLAGLPEKYQKFGIEPCEWAADRAHSCGVQILGKTLAELDSDVTFDVVVATDVIEHVIDVEGFLESALAHVDKNGLLIISTGNPESFFWRRVFKARFWYCSFAEHLVFPSHRYFMEFAARHHLSLPKQIEFKYIKCNISSVARRVFQQLVYAVSPFLYNRLRVAAHRLKRNESPPMGDIPIGAAGVFTDHHVIIFRKQELRAID